ncbi:hypothetical protein ABPG77_010591 [Micractinium sp. CCAP 211/92]
MAHRCCQRAALPLKLAPSLLLLLLAVAAAQEIKLVAGPGCADLPPSPPTELKAVPGDGNVTLTFGRPSNGACVSEYQVTVLPVDASTTRSAPPPRQSTQQFSVTIAGLDNGQQYKFFVKAYAAKYRGGGEAQVVAAPIAACDPSALPLAPTALRATPGIANVTLCWAPTANGGCVDEWRVAIQAVQQSGQRATPAAYKRYNQGGCVTIAELAPGQLYTFSVQAYSAALKSGAYASVQATPLAPPKQWRCVPVPGQYPLCDAAMAGRCAPLTCQQQLAKGQCSAPFMRAVDPATATIIQYCADVCGCSADPAAGTATAARAMSDAMANTNAADGTPTVALRGLRAAAAGATTQASAAAVWASPSGCCAAPPRSFGADDGAEGDGADSGL